LSLHLTLELALFKIQVQVSSASSNTLSSKKSPEQSRLNSYLYYKFELFLLSCFWTTKVTKEHILRRQNQSQSGTWSLAPQ